MCRANEFGFSLFALLYNFLVSWFDGVIQSYSNKNNSEKWSFKWMVLFGWCWPLYYLSTKTLKQLIKGTDKLSEMELLTIHKIRCDETIETFLQLDISINLFLTVSFGLNDDTWISHVIPVEYWIIFKIIFCKIVFWEGNKYEEDAGSRPTFFVFFCIFSLGVIHKWRRYIFDPLPPFLITFIYRF